MDSQEFWQTYSDRLTVVETDVNRMSVQIKDIRTTIDLLREQLHALRRRLDIVELRT